MTTAMTTLGELIHLQRGYDLTETQRRPGSVPIVGSAGVHGYHDTARAKGPGVTLGRRGASFGKVTFVREDFWPPTPPFSSRVSKAMSPCSSATLFTAPISLPSISA